jgi:hypothetical protein
MGKGYAEGPALDERLAAAEQGPAAPWRRARKAVFGSTQKKRDRHFLGWLGEVDPDDLFASGQAWGLSVTEIAYESPKKPAPAPAKAAAPRRKTAAAARKAATTKQKPAAASRKPAAAKTPAARPKKLARAS